MTTSDLETSPRRGAARVRLAALGALLLTLAVGIALGWSASRWAMHRGRTRGDRGDAVRMDGRFLDRLDLSAAQRARVDSILERRRSQLDAFWAGPGTQLRAIVDSTREEVRSVLTPAQRAAYDSIGARRRRERGGPPRGPAPRPKPGS